MVIWRNLLALTLTTAAPCLALAGGGPGSTKAGSAAAARRYQEGYQFQQEKKYAQAEQTWVSFLKEFPKDPIAGLAYANLGVCALATNQLDLAVEAFDQAMTLPQVSPEDVGWNTALAHLRRGEAKRTEADFDRAANLFRQLSTNAALNSPTKQKAMGLAGDCRFTAAKLATESKQWANAATRFEAFLEQHPTHARANEARMALVDCHAAGGRPEKAEAILAYLHGRKNATDGDMVLQRWGELAFANKKYEFAIHLWTDLLKKHPTSKYRNQVLLALGEAQEQQGKFQDALVSYGDVEGKEAPAAIWRLGQLHEKLKQPEKALAAYDRIVKFFATTPLAAQAELQRVELMLQTPSRRKDGVAALELWGRTRSEDVRVGRIWYRAASRLYESGEFAEARPLAVRASQTAREADLQTAALQLVAQTSFQLKEYTRADDYLAAFFKNVTGDKTPQDVLILLARTKGRLGKAEDALAVYEHLLAGKEGPIQRPEQVRCEAVLLALATAKASTDHVKIWLKELADDAPKSLWTAEAHFHFAQASVARQSYQEALDAAQVALESKVQAVRPQALYLAGFSAAKNKRPEDAIDYFEDLLKEFPAFEKAAEARFSLGTAQLASKRTTEAQATFQAFATLYPTHPLAGKAREQAGGLKPRGK